MLNLQTFLPKKLLCCCKPGVIERRKSRAFEHVLEETEISSILTQLRVLNAAAKETRTKLEWKELKRLNSLLAYSDLDDPDELENHGFRKESTKEGDHSPHRSADEEDSFSSAHDGRATDTLNESKQNCVKK